MGDNNVVPVTSASVYTRSSVLFPLVGPVLTFLMSGKSEVAGSKFFLFISPPIIIFISGTLLFAAAIFEAISSVIYFTFFFPIDGGR